MSLPLARVTFERTFDEAVREHLRQLGRIAPHLVLAGLDLQMALGVTTGLFLLWEFAIPDLPLWMFPVLAVLAAIAAVRRGMRRRRRAAADHLRDLVGTGPFRCVIELHGRHLHVDHVQLRHTLPWEQVVAIRELPDRIEFELWLGMPSLGFSVPANAFADARERDEFTRRARVLIAGSGRRASA